MKPTEKPLTLPGQKVSCSRCCLRELCVPADIAPQQEELLHALIKQQNLNLRRGEHLYRAGMPFHSLFAIHTGSVKTYMLADDGREWSKASISPTICWAWMASAATPIP